MNVFLALLKPAIPLFVMFGLLALLFGLFRFYQIYTLKQQAGNKNIQGIPAKSLSTEKMRIRESARAKGIEGEEGIALILDELAEKFGLVVLHDLSMPGTTANIDHLVIQAKAVFVIDAKNYQGRVNIKKDTKGVMQLYVGRSKQTALAQKLKSYSEKIERYLNSRDVEVTVVPLLAFYDAEFHPESKYKINGVMVNVSGIQNELMRFAVKKGPGIDTEKVAELILKEFPFK